MCKIKDEVGQTILSCVQMLETYYDLVRTKSPDDVMELNKADKKEWTEKYYPDLVKKGIVEDYQFFDKNNERFGIGVDARFNKFEYCHFLYRCYRALAEEYDRYFMTNYVYCCITMLNPYVEKYRNLGNEDRVFSLSSEDMEKWKNDFYKNLSKSGLISDCDFFADPTKKPTYGIGSDGIFKGSELTHFLYGCYKYIYSFKHQAEKLNDTVINAAGFRYIPDSSVSHDTCYPEDQIEHITDELMIQLMSGEYPLNVYTVNFKLGENYKYLTRLSYKIRTFFPHYFAEAYANSSHWDNVDVYINDVGLQYYNPEHVQYELNYCKDFARIYPKGSMSDKGYCKIIHNHLCDICRWPTKSSDKENDRETQEAWDVFKKGNAYCLGYALAFQMLCAYAKITCVTITGSAGGPHAWNHVLTDGKKSVLVDVMWDDTGEFGKYKYDYFWVDPSQCSSRIHDAGIDDFIEYVRATYKI